MDLLLNSFRPLLQSLWSRISGRVRPVLHVSLTHSHVSNNLFLTVCAQTAGTTHTLCTYFAQHTYRQRHSHARTQWLKEVTANQSMWGKSCLLLSVRNHPDDLLKPGAFKAARGGGEIVKTTMGKWRRTGSSDRCHLPRRLCACWQTELHSESEFYSESIKASVLSVFYMHYIVQCNHHLKQKPCPLPVHYVSKKLITYHACAYVV